MKRLDLMLHGKGGVGKSFFAVNFVQFLKDKGIAPIAIDSDNENSTLKRFHPDTRFLDLNNRRELDGIFTALEKADLVVMDCRAASTDLFIDYFTEIDLSAVLSELGAASRLRPFAGARACSRSCGLPNRFHWRSIRGKTSI
jgi:cellulose biosynthesis protein BcsQ